MAGFRVFSPWLKEGLNLASWVRLRLRARVGVDVHLLTMRPRRKGRRLALEYGDMTLHLMKRLRSERIREVKIDMEVEDLGNCVRTRLGEHLHTLEMLLLSLLEEPRFPPSLRPSLEKACGHRGNMRPVVTLEPRGQVR